MRGRRTVALLVGGCATFGVAACGGGERQDKAEKAGNYKVDIVSASFPEKQSLADATTMKISVHNADTKTLPNVAITVGTEPGESGGAPQAFASDIADPNVADSSRPIWIVDQGPKGGDTAYTNTWALGPLKAGETRDFEWKVTAVKPGDFTIDYSVSPGLNGKAKLASGGTTKGTFKVTVDDRPPDARVGDNGEVIREPASSTDSP
jgi:hypothetical protein